jgi:hypothetical protein
MQSLKRVEILSELITVTLLDCTKRVIEPFYFRTDDDYHCIPEGFILDGASIPRWPITYWWLGGKYDVESAPHDWLYFSGFYPQRQCDDYYYLFLIAGGAPKIDAWGSLMGLRIGGHKAYNLYAKRRAEIQAKIK